MFRRRKTQPTTMRSAVTEEGAILRRANASVSMDLLEMPVSEQTVQMNVVVTDGV